MSMYKEFGGCEVLFPFPNITVTFQAPKNSIREELQTAVRGKKEGHRNLAY